jgi:Flp pilus assembly protein CpaB
MKALRFLVIFMAVLIVIGFSVIVLTIAHRLKHDDADTPLVAGTASIALPPGARVLDMAGAGGRLALRIEAGPGGRQSLMLIDPATGRLAETITLAPPADATTRSPSTKAVP